MEPVVHLLERLDLFRSNPLRRNVVAVIFFVVALGLRFLLGPVLPQGFPFLTFFPAVILTAFICGPRLGALVAVASLGSAWFFFVEPVYSFALPPSAAVALAFFALVCIVDIVIIEALLRALAERETERRKARALAEQRDALFRELQHRVSNNLQATAALLHIQARGLSDSEAKRSLEEATQRINVIAQIQRMFVDPGVTGARLDSDFVRTVAERCLAAAGMLGKVSLDVNVAPAMLPQDTFLPVALILTESVSNAIEHGLQKRDAGSLTIDVTEADGQIRLTVGDDGPGPGAGFDAATSQSVGMQVIRAFTRQIDGRFLLHRGQSTVSELTFPAIRS